MSYLELAQQARARYLARGGGATHPSNAAPPDELNEVTKKPPASDNATAALCAAYRRWFALTVAEADGTPTDPAEAATLHQRIVRLTDDAGPLWADAVYADTLRRFRWETGRCGLCGGLGHPRGGA